MEYYYIAHQALSIIIQIISYSYSTYYPSRHHNINSSANCHSNNSISVTNYCLL